MQEKTPNNKLSLDDLGELVPEARAIIDKLLAEEDPGFYLVFDVRDQVLDLLKKEGIKLDEIWVSSKQYDGPLGEMLANLIAYNCHEGRFSG